MYPDDLLIAAHRMDYFCPRWMLIYLSIIVSLLNHIQFVSCVLPVSTFWIEENVEKGTLIGEIPCPYSGGCNNLKQVTYTLLAQGQVSQFFRVDSNEGYIHAAQKIDREKLCADSFHSSLHTGALPATNQVSRTRRGPKRSKLELNKITQEATLSGSTTNLLVPNSQKRLKRTSKDVLNHLPSNTCQVQFQVHISLTQTDGTAENYLQDVQIMIADVNDNVPEFYPPRIVLSILESSPIDAEFRLPQAVDSDSGTHGITNYRLVGAMYSTGKTVTQPLCANSQTEASTNSASSREHNGAQGHQATKYATTFPPFAGDFFVLKLETDFNGLLQPILKQTRQLDREQHEMLYFCLIAEDGGGNQGVLSGRIDLLDANDNVPQWRGLPYRVSLSECDHQISATAFPTNGLRLIFNLHAEDKDAGRNGIVTYRLAKQEAITHRSTNFKSHPPTVIIKDNQVFLASNLDYETLPKFWIRVEAVDAGGLSNFTEIEVNVEDCNDHAPTIEIFPLTHKVDRNSNQIQTADIRTREGELLWLTEEEQARVQLATVMVHDLDERSFAEITCHLEGRTLQKSNIDYIKYFQLESITSFPSASPNTKTLGRMMPSVFTLYKREGLKIDREKVSFITLIIVCSDNGVPKSYETRKVMYVKLKDINDNAPKVGRTNATTEVGAPLATQTIRVMENEPFGTLVGTVWATDDDEGINAQLTYTFLSKSDLGNVAELKIMPVNGQELFELDRTTGNLYTQMALDREMNSSFFTYIRVSDQGSPALSSTVLLHIVVADANDSPPHFFSSAGTNGRIVFVVNESIGRTRVHGRLIGQLNATDADEGTNAVVQFEFVEDSLAPKGLLVTYRVTAKGKIYADGILDREQCKEHQFTVRAVDSAPAGQRLTASAVVIVKLKDINDSPPNFLSPSTKQDGNVASDLINITANLSPGTVLYRIHVTDLDEPGNTQLKFVLRSAKFLSNFFTLRPNPMLSSEVNGMAEANADLILANPLSQLPSMRTFTQDVSDTTMQKPKSFSPKEYFLYIIVKDSEQEPSHSNTARLQLHIYPENYEINHMEPSQSTRVKNTSRSANTLSRTRSYNTEPQSHMADHLKEVEPDRDRYNKTSGLTAILVIAITAVCIFLGLFCFVAFLYLRGSSVRREENGNHLSDLPGKPAPLPCTTVGDNVSTSDHALYWELFSPRDTLQERVGSSGPLKCNSVDNRDGSCHQSDCTYLLTTPPVPANGENYTGLSIQLTPVPANNDSMPEDGKNDIQESQAWRIAQPIMNRYSTLVPVGKFGAPLTLERVDKESDDILEESSNKQAIYEKLSQSFIAKVNRKGGGHLSPTEGCHTSSCSHYSQLPLSTFVVNKASPAPSSIVCSSVDMPHPHQSTKQRILQVRYADLCSHPQSTDLSTNTESVETGRFPLEEFHITSASEKAKHCNTFYEQTFQTNLNQYGSKETSDERTTSDQDNSYLQNEQKG